MALTKAPPFDTRQKRTAELLKALGHPARIAIVELLARREACICGDISSELPLAQSTVSQHLKVLKLAGVIRGEIDGVRICYCLDSKGLQDINELFPYLLEKISPSTGKSCC